MAEHWKPIPGAEGAYEVSDMGRVRSLDRYTPGSRSGHKRFVRGKTLKPWNQGDGYKMVHVTPIGKVFVHRLVLLAFVGERPSGCETRHLNGDPSDNRLQNLAWGDPLENAQDKRRHGTVMRGEKAGNAKLTRGDVVEIRALREQGTSIYDVARKFGISIAQVSRIANKHRWGHVA